MIGRAPESARLVAWRKGFQCPSCQGVLTGGPMVICSANHRNELDPSQLRWPIDPRYRWLKERGYWLRWVMGVLAVFALLMALYVNVLAILGAAVPIAAGAITIVACVASIVALLVAPAVLRLPTSSRIEREIEADVQ